jgi:uncharacterized SAM-binding protein YcdF (DUF218 family)
MIDALAETFKAYLLPGSLSLLLILTTVGAALLFLDGRWRKVGQWGLATLVVVYWLLATPVISNFLVWTLSHGYAAIEMRSEADTVQAIVVLGGGAVTYDEAGARLSTLSDASALRALEGIRLYRLLNPNWMVVSGGPSGVRAEPESDVMRQALINLGIPPERILEESTSGNTYEQAINLRRLLGNQSIQRFVLVTSEVHMPRAMAVFRHAGLDPIPSPAPEAATGHSSGVRLVLPSLDALRTSQSALREVLGLVYYGLRGWLTPAPSATLRGALSFPTGLG